MHRQTFINFIRSLVDTYDEYMKPLCKELDMPQTSLAILLFIANNPATPTAKDIAHFRGIKPNLVSLHVAKLVYDGYLERRSVAGDRRKINLVCTKKAAPIIERGQMYQERFYQIICKGFDESELMYLRESLERLLRNASLVNPPAEVT